MKKQKSSTKIRESIKKKSEKLTSSFIIAIIILLVSFLPYVHDLNIFRDVAGFSGFSSLRIGIWVVSIFTFGLVGWILAFFNSKNKSYRFMMLAPIFMGALQLLIYVLDFRNNTINEFNIKVLINFLILLLIILTYFKFKTTKSE